MEITLFVDKRHVKDILRSLSHELVHHKQNCRGEFDAGVNTEPGYAQNDEHMRKCEAEAYLHGSGFLFRDWEDSLKKENQVMSKSKNLKEQEESIFAPNHYCIHHGAVYMDGAIQEGKVISHNWNKKLQKVTKYNMQFKNGAIVEGIKAEDIFVTEASLAKEHPGKADDGHPPVEEDLAPGAVDAFKGTLRSEPEGAVQTMEFDPETIEASPGMVAQSPVRAPAETQTMTFAPDEVVSTELDRAKQAVRGAMKKAGVKNWRDLPPDDPARVQWRKAQSAPKQKKAKMPGRITKGIDPGGLDENDEKGSDVVRKAIEKAGQAGEKAQRQSEQNRKKREELKKARKDAKKAKSAADKERLRKTIEKLMRDLEKVTKKKGDKKKEDEGTTNENWTRGNKSELLFERLVKKWTK